MNPPERNDDFSWLVYADWLEDHDRPGASEIRDQILETLYVLPWSYEYRTVGVGVGGGVGVGVGVGGVGGVGVGVDGVGGVGVGG